MDSNLKEAAVKGDIEPFKEKQQHLEQIVTSSGETILHMHIKSSKTPSTEFMKRILEICPSLLLQGDHKHDTPLHVAAKYGHSVIVELLLKCTKDQPQELESGERVKWRMLKLKNNDDCTALDEAVRHNKIEVVKTIIKEAGNFSHIANKLHRILDLAAKTGDHEILVAGDSSERRDIMAHEDPNGVTALQKALMTTVERSRGTILHNHVKSSETPSIQFVEKLLDICPSLLLHINDKGNTLLHVAAERGHSDIVEILLKRARDQPQQEPESKEKADSTMLKMKNIYGQTALDRGLHSLKIEVVKILIGEYADLEFSYIANSLENILCYAATTGDHEIVVAIEKLEKRESGVLQGPNGMTALQTAIMNFGSLGFWSCPLLHFHMNRIKYSATPATEFIEKILDICPTQLLKMDHRNDSLLHVAAEARNSTILELLLRHARDQGQELAMLRMRNDNYNTALQEAVMQYGNTKVVEVLIQKADPDISYFVNKYNRSPLYLAVLREDYEMVATIINSDIRGTQSPDTILHIYLESKEKPSMEFVKKILEIRPSLLLQVNPEGETPLHVAIKYGHLSIVEILLKHARDQAREPKSWERDDMKMLTMKNNDGNTILDEAVQHGKNELVKILIKEADLDFSYFANEFGKILYLAAETGDYDMVAEVAKLRSPELVASRGPNEMKTFLATIVDTDIPGAQFKDTLLHIHIRLSKRPSTEFIEKILEICPSLILQCNENEDIPLHLASKCGYSNIVAALLKYARSYQYQELKSRQQSGLRVDWEMLKSKNKRSNTALHEAVLHDQTDVVEILTKDADPYFSYFPNNSCETPLYLAAARGDVKMVCAILRSCNLAAYEGPNGMTALHAAVLSCTPQADIEYNHIQSLMREIYNRKVSLTKSTDHYGWTPLHYAAYYGLRDAVDILLELDKSAAYIADEFRKMIPLHIAASQGQKEIIQKIISKCAESCEIMDDKGWNVLHFSMLSLKKNELVDLLKNPLVRSLINKENKDGNTPLHIRAAAYRDSFSHIGNHRAINKQSISVEHILKYGSHRLEEEIQKLFEDVGNGQYPKGVIHENKDEHYSKIRDERRKKYYDGLKETRSSQLLVATLIATVTFTAAFTIPGGYSSGKGLDEGTAVLNKNLGFQIFIITDTIAMTLSLSAVFVHFIMSFEKFQKFQNLFTLASCLTMLAMGAVVVAFVTGIYSVLAPSLWLAITTCFLGISFFLLVLCALDLIYWRVFPKWLCPIWKLSKRLGRVKAGSGNVLPTHLEKRN